MRDDEKVRREILKAIYDEWKQSPWGYIDASQIGQNVELSLEDELEYHLTRLKEEGYIESSSNRFRTTQITTSGIEKLTQDGYETILDEDYRYVILRELYEIDRRNGGRASYLNLGELLDNSDLDRQTLTQNAWYLKEKGLIETRSGSPIRAKISSRGRTRYEEYRDDNILIPRMHTGRKWAQHTIAEGDFEKAANVFRDFVELASEEVIIIDSFAKAGLYEMLEDVPPRVEIKVIGSDREMDEKHKEKYRDFSDGRSAETELKYHPYDDWMFHARYVIRDREEGYVWDHTFADSGSGQHTISEMRPVNLQNTLDTFDDAWETGEVVE